MSDVIVKGNAPTSFDGMPDGGVYKNREVYLNGELGRNEDIEDGISGDTEYSLYPFHPTDAAIVFANNKEN